MKNHVLERIKQVPIPVLMDDYCIQPHKIWGDNLIYRIETSDVIRLIHVDMRMNKWSDLLCANVVGGNNIDLLVHLGHFNDWQDAAIWIEENYIIGSNAAKAENWSLSNTNSSHEFEPYDINKPSINVYPYASHSSKGNQTGWACVIVDNMGTHQKTLSGKISNTHAYGGCLRAVVYALQYVVANFGAEYNIVINTNQNAIFLAFSAMREDSDRMVLLREQEDWNEIFGIASVIPVDIKYVKEHPYLAQAKCGAIQNRKQDEM